MNKKNIETIAVLDFGSQYTQLIARRVRELNIYSKIFKNDIDLDELLEYNIKAIILSGGPSSVYEPTAPKLNIKILDLKIPILGVCYGLQILLNNAGGKISKGKVGEYGNSIIKHNQDNLLFKDIPKTVNVWMSHGDKVNELSKNWQSLAISDNNIIAAISHNEKPIYAVQFHPEVTHTEFGTNILSNFLFKICQLKKSWTADNFIKDAIEDIQNKVGKNQVICGLSGGVDSSVVATLLHKAIGDQSKAIFIDHGLLRKNEVDDVLINYVQSKWKMEREGERWIINLLKLSKLRNMINLKPALNFTPIPFFRDILQESKQMVSNWDGKMYFVYLPSINRYLTGSEDLYRDFVLQTASELDIPIIDIHKKVFDLHPDPLSLFPFRMRGHYNAEGYKLVAESICKRLKADGIIPLNSKNLFVYRRSGINCYRKILGCRNY